MEVTAPTTSASVGYVNINQNMLPATVSVPGLGSGETASIEFTPDKGVTWYDVKEGVTREFTETNNVFSVEAPVSLKISKGSTSAAVGIYILETYDI